MITSIELEGFKSLKDRCKVYFKGLTILAGANSSGKSSVMQPLLLFKQTLEATYDPGILKIDGPNVYFENYREFLTFKEQPLIVELESINSDLYLEKVKWEFVLDRNKNFELNEFYYLDDFDEVRKEIFFSIKNKKISNYC